MYVPPILDRVWVELETGLELVCCCPVETACPVPYLLALTPPMAAVAPAPMMGAKSWPPSISVRNVSPRGASPPHPFPP